MDLSREDVIKIAREVKLEIPNSSIDVVVDKLKTVLDFVRPLLDIETKGEKVKSVSMEEIYLNENKASNEGSIDISKNGKSLEMGYYKVPKVLED